VAKVPIVPIVQEGSEVPVPFARNKSIRLFYETIGTAGTERSAGTIGTHSSSAIAIDDLLASR
jgi:hypothetical protein